MDRSDVIKRLLYPKCKSAIEFQFDTLIVNPLLSYITIQDIASLNKIATSIKYSSKPKEKYKMIDQIMIPRGFKKMASGTNRVVYRCLNDYRIVIKIAIDKVGLSDNGHEYQYQHLLKPFVSKCFEVSPCGTVGLFERVNPITSREEFINISDDIFDLINNIIGKYVLEDIGEKFYMNYGLREGFGPVLLDYPYVFELDGRKLYCNCPDPMEPSGTCGGEIDYDIGYNNLICTKCGKRYLATELRTEGSNEKPNIIVKGDDIIMKCVLMRGNEVVSKLNSEKPVATNTIKPREEFNRLKSVIARDEQEEKESKPYRPTIVDRDKIDLQVKIVGTPRGKNIDKEKIIEDMIVEENTPHVEVDMTKKIEKEEKSESKLKVGVFYESENDTKIMVVPNTITSVANDNSKYSVLVDMIINDPNVFVARKTDDNEIWDVEKDELVGIMFIENSKDESSYNDMSEDEVKSVYTDNDKSGFTMGDMLKGKLPDINGSLNENYKTENIVSHIDNHYSSAEVTENYANQEEKTEPDGEVKDESNEIPDVVIHPRKEISEEAKTILENY